MERDPGDWRQKYPISFIPYPMNGYRLVVADIDGTLVTRTREITPGVLSAVRAAQSQGVVVCLPTGRISRRERQLIARFCAGTDR